MADFSSLLFHKKKLNEVHVMIEHIISQIIPKIFLSADLLVENKIQRNETENTWKCTKRPLESILSLGNGEHGMAYLVVKSLTGPFGYLFLPWYHEKKGCQDKETILINEGTRLRPVSEEANYAKQDSVCTARDWVLRFWSGSQTTVHVWRWNIPKKPPKWGGGVSNDNLEETDISFSFSLKLGRRTQQERFLSQKPYF